MKKGEVGMESTMTSKKEQKPATKKNNVSAIRVSKATGKLAQQVAEKANAKAFGKNVKMDKIVAKALTKLTQDDIRELQEGSLSNQDRFERDFAAYCAEHGKVSKDEYLGIRLNAQSEARSEGAKTQKTA
jgi:hypothetical protein